MPCAFAPENIDIDRELLGLTSSHNSVRSLLVACCVIGLFTACSANGEGSQSTASLPVDDAAPTTAPQANCADVNRDPPGSLGDDLTAWLRETQSDLGDVPDDLDVVIVDAVGQGETWVFVATFNARFEAGVFALDESSEFQVLWGGVAGTESEIRDSITATAPELPPVLVACLDVSGFVDE